MTEKKKPAAKKPAAKKAAPTKKAAPAKKAAAPKKPAAKKPAASEPVLGVVQPAPEKITIPTPPPVETPEIPERAKAPQKKKGFFARLFRR